MFLASQDQEETITKHIEKTQEASFQKKQSPSNRELTRGGQAVNLCLWGRSPKGARPPQWQSYGGWKAPNREPLNPPIDGQTVNPQKEDRFWIITKFIQIDILTFCHKTL